VNDSQGSALSEPSAVPDSGTAERLIGAVVPSLMLESTQGPVDVATLAADLLIVFVFPHATGLPDAPVPGWDAIPGAQGCTAQACSFRDHHDRLRALGAEVAGLSVQTVEEQRSFAARVGLHYRLIADPGRHLASALDLPTFTAHGRTFYRRLTLIAKDRRVVKAFSPVPEPEANAREVATWLERAGGD
jgi:peroxiredoxin